MRILTPVLVVAMAAAVIVLGPSHSVYARGSVSNAGAVGFYDRVENAIRVWPASEVERFARVRKLAEKGQKKRAVRELQFGARLAAVPSGNRPLAPVYNEIAGELLMDMNDYDGAQRVLERALSQLSAYRVEIGAVMVTEASAAIYRETEQRARKQLEKVRQDLRYSRATLKWIRTDMPSLQVTPPPSTSSEAVQADGVIRQWMPKLKRGFVFGAKYEEPPHMILGQALTTKGDAPAAVIELLAAVEVTPKSTIARYSLGWAYLTDGRLRQAAAAFREACRLGDALAGVLAADVEKSWARFTSSRLHGVKK